MLWFRTLPEGLSITPDSSESHPLFVYRVLRKERKNLAKRVSVRPDYDMNDKKAVHLALFSLSFKA